MVLSHVFPFAAALVLVFLTGVIVLTLSPLRNILSGLALVPDKDVPTCKSSNIMVAFCVYHSHSAVVLWMHS